MHSFEHVNYISPPPKPQQPQPASARRALRGVRLSLSSPPSLSVSLTANIHLSDPPSPPPPSLPSSVGLQEYNLPGRMQTLELETFRATPKGRRGVCLLLKTLNPETLEEAVTSGNGLERRSGRAGRLCNRLARLFMLVFFRAATYPWRCCPEPSAPGDILPI